MKSIFLALNLDLNRAPSFAIASCVHCTATAKQCQLVSQTRVSAYLMIKVLFVRLWLNGSWWSIKNISLLNQPRISLQSVVSHITISGSGIQIARILLISMNLVGLSIHLHSSRTLVYLVADSTGLLVKIKLAISGSLLK